MWIEWTEVEDAEGRGRVRAALAAVGATYFELPRGLVVVARGAPWMSTLTQISAVRGVHPLPAPYKLSARRVRPEGSRVVLGETVVGGPEIVLGAGPCSVETRAQMLEVAHGVRAASARLLRAGAYKPRTSPWTFQGLGAEGLALLAEAGRAAGLPTVTEVVAVEDVERVAAHADVLQVGARNAQNFALLSALGRVDRPVLLKRGPSMTLEELLCAADYVLAGGNPHVILCERGLRGWDPTTRNLLDLAAVAALKQMTHLPVLVDPSHGTGRRALVAPLARAAVAAGADGLLVEVHPRPDESWTDADQALGLDDLAALARALTVECAVSGRSLAVPAVEDEADLVARRASIDALDRALVALLSARLRIGRAVGDGKRRLGHPVSAPEREQQVLGHVSALAAAVGDVGAVRRAFEAVIRETRGVQETCGEA